MKDKQKLWWAVSTLSLPLPGDDVPALFCLNAHEHHQLPAKDGGLSPLSVCPWPLWRAQPQTLQSLSTLTSMTVSSSRAGDRHWSPPASVASVTCTHPWGSVQRGSGGLKERGERLSEPESYFRTESNEVEGTFPQAMIRHVFISIYYHYTVCVCARTLSCFSRLRLFATLWTVALSISYS